MAHVTHWDSKYPLKAVIDISRLREDSLPKAALVNLEASITGRIYNGISSRINDAIDKSGKSRVDIASLMPKTDGTGSITDRHLRTLIAEPYRMRVPQVERLCDICGCTIDYLRGDHRDDMPHFPMESDEYRTVNHVTQALKAYQVLTESNIEERLYADLVDIVGILHDLDIVPGRFEEEVWWDGSALSNCHKKCGDGLDVSGTINARKLERLIWAISDIHECFWAIESLNTN